MEYSGRVAAVGERATLWKVGDEVMGIVGGGAYAERLAVHERQVLAVPKSVGVADAAAIPEVFITAWDALVLQGGLACGRVALVHAGASGVGTAAIQIAKAIGARVFVTCSTKKVDACLALGADAAIDYTSTDFVEVARQLTGDRGVDVVLDVIGGDYVDREPRRAWPCRVGSSRSGLMAGGVTSVNLGKLLPKRVTITGTVLRGRPLEEKIAVTRASGSKSCPSSTETCCIR